MLRSNQSVIIAHFLRIRHWKHRAVSPRFWIPVTGDVLMDQFVVSESLSSWGKFFDWHTRGFLGRGPFSLSLPKLTSKTVTDSYLPSICQQCLRWVRSLIFLPLFQRSRQLKKISRLWTFTLNQPCTWSLSFHLRHEAWFGTRSFPLPTHDYLTQLYLTRSFSVDLPGLNSSKASLVPFLHRVWNLLNHPRGFRFYLGSIVWIFSWYFNTMRIANNGVHALRGSIREGFFFIWGS